MNDTILEVLWLISETLQDCVMLLNEFFQLPPRGGQDNISDILADLVADIGIWNLVAVNQVQRAARCQFQSHPQRLTRPCGEIGSNQ